MITLLYVDDEPTLLEKTRTYLEQSGYCVDTAGSAQEALPLIRNNSYDVIVSDYLMPGMDGIELLRKIRQTGIRTPFIILIGKNQEGVAVNALRSNADFYLEKKVSFWADLPRVIDGIRNERDIESAPRPAVSREDMAAAEIPQADARKEARREAPVRTREDAIAALVPEPAISKEPHLSPELKALAGSLSSLGHPVFGIDREGRVIIWNAAIARLTGIDPGSIIGKGEHAYAVPFYGKPRPMLVDYILNPQQKLPDNAPPVVRNGDVFLSGTEQVILKNKPVLLSGRGTAVTDDTGAMIAAIQSVAVSDPITGSIPEGLFEEEQYIGGISSGVAVMEAGSTVPDVIRTESWKYGLYATDKRLFVVESLDAAAGSVSLPAMPFIVQKIFGGRADEQQRSLQELAAHKVLVIPRRDIASIKVSPQEVSVGCIIVTMKSGETFHILLARKQALSHVDWILHNFYPEIPRVPGTTRYDPDLLWLDEIWMHDLIDRLRPEDPLRDIGESPKGSRKSAVQEQPMQEGEWTALAQFAEKMPFSLFAIDREGRVIVWNAAIATLTGIAPGEMVGRGGYAHALPFYGRARPMLVDSLLMHRLGTERMRKAGLPEGAEDTVTGDPEEIRIGGRPVRMQERATCIYDDNGEITAAIQSVIVRELVPASVPAPGPAREPVPESIGTGSSAGPVAAPAAKIARNGSAAPNGAGIISAVRAVSGGYPAGIPRAEKPEEPAAAVQRPAVPAGGTAAPFEREIGQPGAGRVPESPAPGVLANRVIFDAHEGIMAYDRELKVTVWNRFMEDLTGLDAAAAYGRTVSDIFPVIRDSGGVFLMERALDGQTVESPDLCIRLPTSGKQVWVRMICSPLSDAGYTVIGGVGIIQDATARKVMECALESTMLQLVDSEEKYRNVFNTSNEPLILVDTINKNILDFNKATLVLYGYSSQEMLSMSISDLSDGSDGKGIVKDPERPHIRLCRHRKKDGTVFPADVSTAIFELKGRSVRILSIRDLSIIQQNADALRLANSKLSLMIGITRHDILNKITVLIGFNELLKGMITDPEAAKMIAKQGNMMDLICSQIEFTREYDNLGAKAPQWQNVLKCVRRTFIQFSGNKVPLHCDTGNLEIYADPLLEKVFYNLFDNAFRYAKGMTGIRVFSIIHENGLLLILEDDGPGILTEEKLRIFERGFGRNTGLGLFFVREILSITDITITENGVPGHGARFEIAIPKGGYRFNNLSA